MKRSFSYTIVQRTGDRPWYVHLDQVPRAYIARFRSYQEARQLVDSFIATSKR